MPHLYAVDCMALLYRHHFAMIRRPLINSKGMNVSGLHGFFKQIITLLKKEKPEYLFLASDLPDPTFRHEIFPQYKATREQTPDDLIVQIPYLARFAKSLGIAYCVKSGWEADDIIGTLVHVAKQKDVITTILTNDKDYLQLVSDTTKILNSAGDLLGNDAVFEKFGCDAQYVPDALGLIGDSSDNIPGVSGIGEKTAKKLLADYGNMEGIYQNINQIRQKKIKENLLNFKENALLSKELATIRRDVPIDFDWQAMQFQQNVFENNVDFIEILQELEFQSLLKQFAPKQTIQKVHQTADALKINQINQQHQLDEILASLQKAQYFVLDIKLADGTNPTSQVVSINICYQQNVVDCLVLVDFSHDQLHAFFQQCFALSNHIVVPDAKQLYHGLQNFDLDWGQMALFDAQIIAHLTSQSNDLPNDQTDACQYIHQLWQFFPLLRERFSVLEATELYQILELPLAQVLVKMEQTGVAFDEAQCHAYSESLKSELNQLTAKIYQEAGEIFNINSIVELQTILYDKLELHQKCQIKPKKIKTGNGLSTDEETLLKMQQFELPRLLLLYRELSKLQNTYVLPLPQFAQKTGRIHSSFKQVATATGRLASDHPNLQNIPIRSEHGRKIRQFFVPSSQDHVFIKADYSQIELRIAAHFSKDPTFLQAFRNDEDIHAITASAIFNVPLEAVSPQMRTKAKEVNFGLIYRMGADKLSTVTNTTKQQAKDFITKFFEKYSYIHSLQEQLLNFARKQGYAQTLMGRKRILHAINEEGLAKSMAEGAAINTPIQGSAAEVIKLAMITIDEHLQQKHMQSKIVLSVHDELVFDAPQEEQEELCTLIKEDMENVMILEIPLKVDIGVGKNWLI